MCDSNGVMTRYPTAISTQNDMVSLLRNNLS